MNPFKTTAKVTLTPNERLIQESKNVFNLFDESLTKLSKVNFEIQTERVFQKERIENLILTEKELATQEANNTKLINKITSFLND